MGDEVPDKIDDIFQAALDRVPGKREAFVERACAGNEDVRGAVKRLLAAHEHAEADGFIKSSVRQVAEQLIGGTGRLTAGHSIGKYKIVKFIGAGGMGEVYLAEDSRLGRPVALKLLPASFTSDALRVRRFEREARAASGLNHQNILTVYDVGREGELHFIAAEFIEGETLRQRTSRSPLELDEALDIATQIAAALAAAHRAGIVHRDIKPENIMLRDDGVVKVLDFGLAKPTEKNKAELTQDSEAETRVLVHTAPGVVMGTVSYMSPEQARGQEVDERTDIWSLGVVLYEMAAGCLPFAAGRADEIIAAIQSKKQPPPLADYADNVPDRLEEIVTRALTKDRERRYQSVKDLQIDLESLKHWLDTQTENLRGSVREQTGVAHPASSAEYVVSGLKQHKRGVALMLAALLIAVAAFAYYSYFADHPQEITSVAVLPFANTGGDPETEYLSDGISESLINSLSQLPQLKVIARSSSFRYRGRESEPHEVARALGVQAVVTGRVVRRGDQLQVSAELVDARDNRHIWGEQYERKAADLLSVQREIAKQISERLRLRLLTEEERKQLTKNYTEDAEAYQLYLKGRYFWNNRRTPEGHRKSIEYFNQATEKDPNYALAFAGLADAYTALPSDSDTPPRDALPKAKAAAARALAIDDTLAEAHASLAAVKFSYEWDFSGAEEELKRAVALNPNSSSIHQRYAGYLSLMGRHQEAIAEIKRARELDPLSLIINTNVGIKFFWAHQYDQVIEELRKTLEIDPNFWIAHLFLGKAYEQKRMYPEAIAELQKARDLSGGSSEAISMMGYVYAVSGRRSEAQQVLDELKELSKQRYVPPFNVAMVYAGLGEKDQAFQWLEKAFEDRNRFMALLKVEPKFEGLRSDPRFADLARRVGLTP